MRKPPMLVGAALAVLSLAASAQALQPGLWEIQQRVAGAGVGSGMADMNRQLGALPPEQRKQMEEMMARQGVRMGASSQASAMVVQICMSREMAEHNEVPMRGDCRMTRQQRSGNTVKVAFACTEPPASGEGEITIASPQAYSSHMVLKSAVAGRSETMTMDAAGKWLKAECGNLKPVVPGR